MTGQSLHASVADVVAYWLAHATNTGFLNRQSGHRIHELTRTELQSDVYISAGRYVADCPNVACNSAAAAWTENPDCCCLACGTVFKPVWPDNDARLAAVEVLLERSNPDWRNWGSSPNRVSDDTGHRYESVAELKAENLRMGDPLPGGRKASGAHPLDAVVG